MPQQEVINILIKYNGKELTSTEIAKFVEQSESSVRRLLRRLKADPNTELRSRELLFEEKKIRFGKVVNPRIVVYWLKEWLPLMNGNPRISGNKYN